MADGSVYVWRLPDGIDVSFQRCARQLARSASAHGSTYTRRLARWLAYIVSIRDGPGGLPDGTLMSLRWICASADGSI